MRIHQHRRLRGTGQIDAEQHAREILASLKKQRNPPARSVKLIARQSLAQLRRVIAPADVPQSADYSLPPGYLIVERLDVTGDQAIFAAHLGPVRRAKPGEILLSCGTRYTIPTTRMANGTWTIKSISAGVC